LNVAPVPPPPVADAGFAGVTVYDPGVATVTAVMA
jgi:hypothetical protein